MRNWLSLGLVLLLSSGVFAACSGEEDEMLPNVDCNAGQVPAFSEVTGFDKCVQCHDSSLTGDARQEAPTSINFDTYEGAKANSEKAASEVKEGAMPPKDSGVQPLTDAEKDVLYRWALCGTPEGMTGMPDAGGADAAGTGDGG